MGTTRRILIIDNDPDYLDSLKELLKLEGYQVFDAMSVSEAKRVLNTIPVQLIITDLRVTDDDDVNDRSGLVFAREFAPTIPKIILTGYVTFDIVRNALGSGIDNETTPAAVDFIAKREGLERLLDAINRVFDKYSLSDYPQFKVGGALTDEDAAVYIARQAEREVITGLQRMDYLLIIEPRQQGKTSLINYLLRCNELKDSVIAYVDTATTDRSTQVSWYNSLSTRILDQLNHNAPNTMGLTLPMNNVQWRAFLSDLAILFESTNRYLIIALDEIGTTIPEATGFFSVLRDVFNSRQAEQHFKRLTFMLVGAFHPRELVDDNKVSPFNIARRVRLHDFTLEQTWRLIKNFISSTKQADILASRVYHWASGQPFLTQQLCTYLQPNSSATDVDDAVERLRREDENHLPPLLKRISADSSLQAYVGGIINGERIKFYPAENHIQARLELLGVIKADAYGYCVFRNRVYKQSLTQIQSFDRSNRISTLESGAPTISHSAKEQNAKGVKVGSKTTILFLAADPTDASRLRLGQELRDIQEKLQMARMRHKFNLKQRMSVRPIDISQAILDERPQIVHFSGHGTSAGELCFEDEVGRARPVHPDALGALFELIAEQVKCVLMNACYSAIQANAISKYIEYVIGMNKAIGDLSAISFTVGFYQALGAGESIEQAYKFGCAQIRLQGIDEHLIPVLLRK